MQVGNKRLTAVAMIIALGALGLINPAQATRNPSNPEPVNQTTHLDSPLASSSTNPQIAAQNLLISKGASWGINPEQFVFDSSVAIANNLTVVRFTQHYANALFLGALVALTIDTEGNLVSYNLKTGQKPNGDQSQNSEPAIAAAKQSFSTAHNVPVSDLESEPAISAIADPTIQSYVTQSTWVWQINVHTANSFDADRIVVDSNSLAVLETQSQIREVNSSPLVCDMQKMNKSAKKVKSKSTYVSSTSIKLKAKKNAPLKLTGIQGGKIWVAIVTAGSVSVSSKIVSIKVKKNQIVVLKPKFKYVPANSSYSIYVGTGKKKPSYDALRLYASPTVSEVAVAITGALPIDTGTLASAGVPINAFYTYVNVSTKMPICDYKNRGLKSTASDKTNTYNFINEFRSYFSSYVDANTDIASELYLGNVSSKLNYGKKKKCVLDDTAKYCSPRITAFTNACLMIYGSISCPNFENAVWTAWRSADCRSGVCNGIFIGRGFAVNDVVAHELTHGLTSAIAFGVYNSTAGAISEALSDVFGESFDQATGAEAEDTSWPVGEDLNVGNFHGAVRNLQGTYSGANPVIDSCWNNDAEMHANVGPVNRFAWLLVNGGDPFIDHPGCTANPSVGRPAINPIGTDKGNSISLMNQLIWSAIPSMGTPTGGSTISFAEFGQIIQTTCTTLWADDYPARCDSAQQALIAVGMSMP